MPEPLILNPADNVAILTEKGVAAAGHKIARRPIAKGAEVVKYGQVIGYRPRTSRPAPMSTAIIASLAIMAATITPAQGWPPRAPG